jgi:hypothetical protein
MRAFPDNFVPPIRRLAIAAVVVTGVLSVGPRPVAAQNSAAPKPAAGSATKKPSATRPARPPAAVRPAPPAIPREEKPAPEPSPDPTLSSATSRPFLTGDEWQDTLQRFEQWLSTQTLYDAEQAQQMRAKFDKHAKTISTADRKQFINDTDAKLQTLYSPRTLDLQNYFTESLSVASPSYVKKARQQLPDVVASTPDQLKERLARIASNHQSTVDVHQAFEQTRQMQIASHEAKSGPHHQEQARPPAGHIASSSTNANRQSRSGYTQARDYYPKTNSSISYSIIPAMPMMTSGGVAMFGGGVAINIQRNR